MTNRELQQLQALPLEIKIAKTKQRLREFVQHYGLGGVYLSFSGGKDSTVLLHIARQVYPNIEAVFCNTTAEFPEVVKFVKSVPGITWVKPALRFKDIIEQYGYPVISKQVSKTLSIVQNPKDTKGKAAIISGYHTSGKKCLYALPQKYYYLINSGFRFSDKCCYYLKKSAFKAYAGRARITGMIAAEGRQRTLSYLRNGCNSYAGDGASMPLGFWTEQDILHYIYQYNVPIAAIYGSVEKAPGGGYYLTGEPRTGCVGCPYGMHLEGSPNRYQRLYKSHPKLWNYYVNYLGFGRLFDYIGIPYKPEPELLDLSEV